jgi:hypothetical protein
MLCGDTRDQKPQHGSEAAGPKEPMDFAAIALRLREISMNKELKG